MSVSWRSQVLLSVVVERSSEIRAKKTDKSSAVSGNWIRAPQDSRKLRSDWISRNFVRTCASSTQEGLTNVNKVAVSDLCRLSIEFVPRSRVQAPTICFTPSPTSISASRVCFSHCRCHVILFAICGSNIDTECLRWVETASDDPKKRQRLCKVVIDTVGRLGLSHWPATHAANRLSVLTSIVLIVFRFSLLLVACKVILGCVQYRTW